MVQQLSYYQNQILKNANNAIQGSLIAYDNVNDWFKFSIVNSNITQNVAIVNTPTVSIAGGGFTSSVTIIGSNITQNVAIVNTPTVSIAGGGFTSSVTIVGPLDASGNVKVDIVASSITGTVNVNEVGVGYNQINLFTNALITASSTTIISTANYQDLVVDTVYGGVLSGSIYTSVYGVEPQSNILTSVIINGITASSNTLTVQRLVVNGPLGAKVAIVVTTAPVTLVTGVFITVEQSVHR